MKDHPVLTEPQVLKNAAHPKRLMKTKPTWQERLLPTMSGLLVGLTVFFFLTTFGQMAFLHWIILQRPAVDINPSAGVELISSAETFNDRINARELEVRSRMEAFLITQRYHQVSVQLMAGLWTRYLGFITGMILALVGASFVLGKLREPAQKLDGKFPMIDFSLRTTSPGIILAVMGVILMFATITDKDNYKITDEGVYLSPIRPVATTISQPVATLRPPQEVFGTPTPASESAPP